MLQIFKCSIVYFFFYCRWWFRFAGNCWKSPKKVELLLSFLIRRLHACPLYLWHLPRDPIKEVNQLASGLEVFFWQKLNIQGTKFKRNGTFIHNNIVHELTGPKINCLSLCITRPKQIAIFKSIRNNERSQKQPWKWNFDKMKQSSKFICMWNRPERIECDAERQRMCYIECIEKR